MVDVDGFSSDYAGIVPRCRSARDRFRSDPPRGEMAMGSGWKLFLTGLVLLGTAGGATKQEWETWAGHPAHFASGDHLGFSVRNTEGTPPRVTRGGPSAAREQGGGGGPVDISQAEILG